MRCAHGGSRKKSWRSRFAEGVPQALRGRKGQSTLEFLLVAMALAAMCLALAAMWRAAKDGRLLELASAHAAHSSKAGIAVVLKDLFEY